VVVVDDYPSSISIDYQGIFFILSKLKYMSNNTSSGGGIGFAGLLTILFIGLKLGGVIAWSWWWVLSPIWISFALVIVILLIAFLIALAVNR
jgi:hypothetical protein